MYPSKFEDLVDFFKILPGVGKKNAERYAYAILALSEEEVEEHTTKILQAKKEIRNCKVCHIMSDSDICQICANDERNKSIICVVESTKDVFAIENSEAYNGLYHVLGGVIAPSKGVFPEDLNIDDLLNRLSGIDEIIIATNPTVEGEVTSLYLSKILANKNILITKLAAGLPMGGHVDYADELTLNRAIDGRIKI